MVTAGYDARRGRAAASARRGGRSPRAAAEWQDGDMIRQSAAVLTVSDGVAGGTRRDASGEVAVEMLGEAGFDVAWRGVVADEARDIETRLRSLAAEGIALVVTSGGTGFGPRDVTPEATAAVLERPAPGLGELMRAEGRRATPRAALSRAVAGSVDRTLIVNLPGSAAGVREGLAAVLPVVVHAVELLQGRAGDHETGHAAAGDGGRHETERPDAGSPAGEAGTAGAPHRGRTAVTATAVAMRGSAPCRVGNRMRIVVAGEVGGTLGCAEFDEAAVADAPAIARAGLPQVRTYRHELGEIDVFLEPEPPSDRLVVVSATDVARRLADMGASLGYAVTLVEPRVERVSTADRSASWEVAQSIERIEELDDRSDLVLTDHDAPGVADVLERALRSPARFVGVMGSRRHVAGYVVELRMRGFTDDELARIRSPLGLDLGGRAPEEVALSIAAGLVAARYGREGGWLDRP
jgi:molybdopterin adenylyltransferase